MGVVLERRGVVRGGQSVVGAAVVATVVAAVVATVVATVVAAVVVVLRNRMTAMSSWEELLPVIPPTRAKRRGFLPTVPTQTATH